MMQTKIQIEDNTFIFNRLAEELFQEELAVNIYANQNKFQVIHVASCDFCDL